MPTIKESGDQIFEAIQSQIDERIDKRLADDEERVRAIVRDELQRMFEAGARATPTPPFMPAGTDTGEESEP